jgi:hypothetical protein
MYDDAGVAVVMTVAAAFCRHGNFSAGFLSALFGGSSVPSGRFFEWFR